MKSSAGAKDLRVYLYIEVFLYSITTTTNQKKLTWDCRRAMWLLLILLQKDVNASAALISTRKKNTRRKDRDIDLQCLQGSLPEIILTLELLYYIFNL